MKKIIVLLLGLAALLPWSCDPCGPFPEHFKVAGAQWWVYKIDPLNHSVPLDTTIPVQADSFGIGVHFDLEGYAASEGFSLFPKLLACSPPPPYSDESILIIVVTSDADYDTDHPAGSVLNDVFVVRRGSKDQTPLNYFLAYEPEAGDGLMLMPSSRPQDTTTLSFTVTYVQDGIEIDSLTYTTPSVRLY